MKHIHLKYKQETGKYANPEIDSDYQLWLEDRAEEMFLILHKFKEEEASAQKLTFFPEQQRAINALVRTTTQKIKQLL